jgi:hypothetical protein
MTELDDTKKGKNKITLNNYFFVIVSRAMSPMVKQQQQQQQLHYCYPVLAALGKK